MTATTVSQAVEKRDAGIVNVMWDRKAHFAAILPDHVDVKSFLGTAAAALYASEGGRSPTLMEAAEASPDSLITALMRCAALGHQPGTDEFYLTPRKVKGRPAVLGIEGYRGVIERMYRSGAVKTVIVREVCARDRFKFVEGDMDKPSHHFGGGEGFRNETGADFFGQNGSRDRGEMVGVYAYAVLMTGAVSRVVILNRDDVLAARDAGGYRPDDEYSPWNRADAGKGRPEFTGRSMWWKTAARRLEPWVPTSAEYRREQLRAAVQAAGPVAQPPQGNGAYIGTVDPRDGSAPVPVTARQAAQLAESGIGTDIHDAEVVEDPGPAVPDEKPASGPAVKPPKPSATARRQLTDLMRQVPLGDEKDTATFIEGVTGHPADRELTRPDVTALVTTLEDALEHAGGDPTEAAHQIWTQHQRAMDAARGAADGAPGHG